MTADLRLGKWQDVLADVECDSLIVDAPYSKKTHKAYSDCSRNDWDPGVYGSRKNTTPINYDGWDPQDVIDFVDSWAPRTGGWMVSITDHVLGPVWSDAMKKHNRYSFAPIPLVEIGSRVRLLGDGPSSWSCWIIVSRPSSREFMKWGALRGAYVYTGRGDKFVMGGKRLDFMQSLVRDYTRPGDLIADPCMGAATTGLAALTEGRRFVGAEMDPTHFEIARKRLARGWTPPLFQDASPVAEQLDLTGSDD